MLDSSCWQFVVHGQGTVKQMGLVSPGFNLHLWKFHRKLKVPGQLLVQDSRLVRGKKIANCLEVDFPAQRYAKFPRMQWGQILVLGCLVEVGDKKGAN